MWPFKKKEKLVEKPVEDTVPHKQSVPEIWSLEDEAKLYELKRQRAQDAINMKLEYFKSLPLEVREQLILNLKMRLAQEATEHMQNLYPFPSEEESNLTVKYYKINHPNHGIYNSHVTVSHINDAYVSSQFPDIEDIVHAHADKTAQEVLIGDKE